jgi:hypothetical protein
MSFSRGTALLAALGLVTGAISLAAAQQPETPRRPNAQNERPEPTPSRTPQTPRPSDTTTAQPGEPGEGATPATPAQPGRPVRENGQGISGFVLGSQVVGVAVQTEDGQQIGTISDLLLTTRMGFGTTTGTGNAQTTNDTTGTVNSGVTGNMGGTSVFAFVSVDAAATGRVAVIPWELLRYENGVFILGFDVTRLNDVPSVMLDDPRILESQEWLGQVNEFFADDLRQIQRARPDLDNATPDTTPNNQQPGTTPRRPNRQTPDPDANPQTPNPRTPGANDTPRTPNNGTRTPQPGNTPTPAPRTSQPGAGANPNP